MNGAPYCIASDLRKYTVSTLKDGKWVEAFSEQINDGVGVHNVYSNGVQFFYTTEYDGDGDLTVCIADEHGVLYRKKLDTGIYNCILTDTYAVFLSFDNENKKNTIEALDLEAWKTTVFTFDRQRAINKLIGIDGVLINADDVTYKTTVIDIEEKKYLTLKIRVGTRKMALAIFCGR